MKFVFFVLLFLFSCYRVYDYDRYFQSFPVRTLDNRRFFLSEVTEQVLILNFYSPTCVPCIEELPALHLLFEEVKKLEFAMFLVVEPSLDKNLVEVPEMFLNREFDEESMRYLQEVLHQEVARRNIKIPVVVAEPPFRIDTDGIITGTPETLIFTTQPLRLRYNFIGPVTTSHVPEEIVSNSRYRFFLELLQNLKETLSATGNTPQ